MYKFLIVVIVDSDICMYVCMYKLLTINNNNKYLKYIIIIDNLFFITFTNVIN